MERSQRSGFGCLVVARVAILTVVVWGLSRPGWTGQEASGDANGKSALAERLLRDVGAGPGIGAVLGGDGSLVIDLVRSSEMLWHVRDPDPTSVTELRRRAEAAGFGIRRVIAESGPVESLPYADNSIDCVVGAQPAAISKTAVDEILRVLRPQGRVVLLAGSADAAGAVESAAKSAQADGISVSRDTHGSWVHFSKPPLKGVDDWSHWEHGPDNNPVSADAVITAPYMTQFLAEPFYIGMPSVTTAAGGRTFLAIGHIAHHRREWDTLQKLIARNGYNGTVLWERKLPENYLVHRSAFVATVDAFLMIDGDGCLLLDPKSGAEKGRLRIPGVDGAWKWMALEDDILYALAGKPDPGVKVTRGDRSFGGWSWGDLSPGYYGNRVPFGFGNTVAAFDVARREFLWKHEEERSIDSRGMAVSGGKVYIYCPDQHLRSLAADTGKVLWTNAKGDVLGLIEQPGKGLRSTPGFRTACLSVATPDALVIQGQTRMNVIGVSTADGSHLWTKKKVTNNPNAIYVDGKIVLGVGAGGSHVVVDPRSGDVLENLEFRKVACTRLTASLDSFFCRGEGTMRFDRYKKKMLVDGAIRPACNDGALPANGLLYVGPWQCDCNLSLIGHMGKCSAGRFRFDHRATEAERRKIAPGGDGDVAPLAVSSEDWATYRGNNDRSAGTKVTLAQGFKRLWHYRPETGYVPTAPTAAADLVFVAGKDGKVRAVDAASGALRWKFLAPAPIEYPPTIWEGRAYVGCNDGHVYVLEAATGRLLWQFRAAPVERHIMVYGNLCSTWPVSSGVLVRDGIAYFAAGIVDHDGTYVYAIDAKTGEIQWQNNSAGHLNEELRKGVSVQGNLTVMGDRLYLAGGNQVSPAPFKLETGECLARSFDNGRPKANGGRFVGVFRQSAVVAGGRILYSATENVSTKGSFEVHSGGKRQRLANGGVAPAWSEDRLVLVNFKHGKVTCCEADKVAEAIETGPPAAERSDRRGARNWLATLTSSLGEAVRWQSNLDEAEKFEAVSLAVCEDAAVVVAKHQQRFRARPEWLVVVFELDTGKPIFRDRLASDPRPEGLLIDRRGHVVVTMLNGEVICYGG